MKFVIILGASGNIAKHVVDILVTKADINLTLFLRNKNRLRNKDVSRCHIIEGDALDYDQMKASIQGQAIIPLCILVPNVNPPKILSLRFLGFSVTILFLLINFRNPDI
jgi:saccharopine dehydrogenase-like NADP-dependent oxidoreductase